MHPLLFCTPIGAAYVWSQALSSLIPKASPEAEHIRGVGLTADCSNADLQNMLHQLRNLWVVTQETVDGEDTDKRRIDMMHRRTWQRRMIQDFRQTPNAVAEGLSGAQVTILLGPRIDLSPLNPLHIFRGIAEKQMQRNNIDLTHCAMRHFTMPYLSLSNSNLTSADLTGSNMDHLAANRTCFRHAILHNVSLRHADLRGADLRGADLSGADLEGAIFDFTTQVNSRTSFYQARNLDKTGKDGDFGLDKACGFTPALNNAEYNPKGARNEDKHTAEVVSLADRRGGRGK